MSELGLKVCCLTFIHFFYLFATDCVFSVNKDYHLFLHDIRLARRHSGSSLLYTRGFVIGATTQNYRDISYTTPPDFLQGECQKCEIWLRFSTRLVFELPSFRHVATHQYQSIASGGCSDDVELSSPKFAAVWFNPL